MMSDKLSHIDANGAANMVDVSQKSVTVREARAQAVVSMKSQTLAMIAEQQHPKGDVIAVARVAGIMAAKKTPELIPLCHPLMLSKVAIDFEFDYPANQVRLISYCKLAGQTGVEMEALAAVNIAALTLFDMCKAVDPAMEIGNIKVLEKKGGKSGHWQPEQEVSQ